jgi:hypothetical protein
MHVMVKKSLNKKGKKKSSQQPLHCAVDRTDLEPGMRKQMQ